MARYANTCNAQLQVYTWQYHSHECGQLKHILGPHIEMDPCPAFAPAGPSKKAYAQQPIFTWEDKDLKRMLLP